MGLPRKPKGKEVKKEVKRTVAIVGSLVLAASTAQAVPIRLPLDKAVKQADLIVIGKLGELDPVKHAGKGPRKAVGKIAVEQVLRGPAGLKTVHLRTTIGRAVGGVPYRPGASGIWILRKDADVYVGGNPTSLQPREKLAAVRKALGMTPPGGDPAAAHRKPLRIAEADNGKTVRATVGRLIDVWLKGDRARTGWELSGPTGNSVVPLKAGGNHGGMATPACEFIPAGGAADPAIGTYLYRYKAVAEGATTLRFNYVRPGGPGVKERRRTATARIRRFQVEIDVRPATPAGEGEAASGPGAAPVAPPASRSTNAPVPAYACPETSFVAAVMAGERSEEHELLRRHPGPTLLVGCLSTKLFPYNWQRTASGNPAWGCLTTTEPRAVRPDGAATVLLDHLATMRPPWPDTPLYVAWISDAHQAWDRDEIAAVRLAGNRLDVRVQATRAHRSKEEVGSPIHRSLRLWRLPTLPAGRYTVDLVYDRCVAIDAGVTQDWRLAARFVGEAELHLAGDAVVACAPRQVKVDGLAGWMPPASLIVRQMGRTAPELLPTLVRDAAGALVPPAPGLTLAPGLWGYGRFCDLPADKTLAERFQARKDGRLPTLCQVHEIKAVRDDGVGIRCHYPLRTTDLLGVNVAQVLCPTVQSLERATVDAVRALSDRHWRIDVKLWQDSGMRLRNYFWNPLLLVPLPEITREIPAVEAPPTPPARVSVAFTFLRADQPGGWYRPVDPPDGWPGQARLTELAAVPPAVADPPAVYGKVILSAEKPVTGGPALEDWIAKDLAARGVANPRAVSGWIRLGEKGVEKYSTEIWDGMLDGETSRCPAVGWVIDRDAEGKATVQLLGFSPDTVDIRETVAAGPGSRTMIDVPREGEAFVALHAGSPTDAESIAWGEAFNGVQAGLRPAKVRLDDLAARAKELKANLDDFELYLAYHGQQLKPFYAVILTRRKVHGSDRDNSFVRRVQISEAEAVRIIDHLAAEGALGRARDLRNKPKLPLPGGPTYLLEVGNAAATFCEDLGWDLAMLKRLDGLRAVLEGDAAKAMDLLLGRLSGLRAQWERNTAVKALQRKLYPQADRAHTGAPWARENRHGATEIGDHDSIDQGTKIVHAAL